MFWKPPTQLTSSQLQQVSIIERKWKKFIFPKQPLDVIQTTDAVTAAYAAVGLAKPQVILCESPHSTLGYILETLVDGLDYDLLTKIERYIKQSGPNLNSSLAQFIVHSVGIYLKKQSHQTFGKHQSDLLKTLRKPLLEEPERRLAPDYVSALKKKLHNLPLKRPVNELVNKQVSRLHTQMVACLVHKLQNRIKDKAVRLKLRQLESLLKQQQFSRFVHRLGKQLSQYIAYNHCIQPELWAMQGVWWDVCIRILNCKYDDAKWTAFHGLAAHCGWILPYENICFVCRRPIKLSFDAEERLHAEGEYSVLYEGGYGLYFHHGVALPQKYGQVKPANWEPTWLVDETNAELRRILIQGIGYDRICRELNASEVDSWKEYTLLKLTELVDDGDGQAISLLKMICPSTRFIHAIRVPPTLQSAREAIRWVNWGIYPEQFEQQS